MIEPFRDLESFGVEYRETQISEADTDVVTAVCDAVATKRVLVFREQVADDGQFVEFLRKIGTLMFTPGETPVAGAAELNVVSNVGRVTPPRSVFHTDTSYVRRPPAIGAMRAVLVPSSGGKTLFSDQVDAASALPAATLSWLRGRTLLHSVTGVDGTIRQERHPVLRRHPTTGEAGLFLSTPERCTGLSGVDERTSARIVRILYDRSTRLRGLYQHCWKMGDIVLWDNRTTMHRADHAGVVGSRILHRGLVMGEIPKAA